MRGLLLSAACAAVVAMPPPASFAQLECAVHQFALQYASAKLPASAYGVLYDALNVAWLCNASVAPTYERAAVASYLSDEIMSGVDRERARIQADRAAAYSAAVHGGDFTTIFYVATNGNDGNAGTLASPFATLQRAQQATRAISPRPAGSTAVYIRAGKYYLGDAPLQLTEADSNVTWAAYPGDAPAPVVLAGSRLLTGLSWSPYAGGAPGTLVAPLNITDARRDAWFASHPGWTRAGPPPLVASLFADGERQIRARWPNANAQDGTGICFSATQRPGEGCAGYSSCATGSTGTQPAPNGVSVSGLAPNRGDSPTRGCSQCSGGGSFQYTIYPPPPDHPVYNQPLPGIGWSNTSVFSFWGSPFSRPSGVTVNAGSSCDAGHWSNVAAHYANNGTDAVVHMFHGGLWGGWQYAVDAVTGMPPTVTAAEYVDVAAAPAAAPAIPGGQILWLRADDLTVTNGAPVTQWKDASGAGNDASQSTGSAQPVFNASCFGGGSLPCVHFSGAQYLDNDGMPLPPQSTIIAVMRDTGTQTTYGSGVFFSKGGRHGMGSKVTDSVASNDDDPAPVGISIPVLMVDWDDSPADPGHRTLATPGGRIISVVYEQAGTVGFVDGCEELQEPAQGAPGTGYEIGTRNAEMGRWLIGDVAEILVYPRALNSSERAAVNSYLNAKWKMPPPPKHCAAPSSNTVQIAFGYGGYQEARGSGINSGQHFYIENVKEEIDVGAEWYYDSAAGMLYWLPNATVTNPAAAALSIPLTDAVISVRGNSSGTGQYATGISFVGLTLTESRITYLEQYEVPSGGDWAIHRNAALFVQDAEGVAITNCTFNQTGGNAIMFSNHVWSSTITDSEFVHIGDSAVALLGSTVAIDGTAPTYPNKNLVARNLIHEIGVYGKQTSCLAQQLSANSTILDNVCFNMPRAGVNFNDGFGGGHLMQHNVVFNTVRETGDHGPLNSWDRQPYLTYSGVDDGFSHTPADGRSLLKAWDLNTQNLMITSYNAVWAYDHDDDSEFVADTRSAMVWGGCKNYLGCWKNCSDNVILYPGVQGRSSGNRRCQTDDNGQFALQYHEGNTCAVSDGDFYSFANCKPDGSLNQTVYYTANNTLLADEGTQFALSCSQTLSFSQWQALGQDVGSTVQTTPAVPQLVGMLAAVLGVTEA